MLYITFDILIYINMIFDILHVSYRYLYLHRIYMLLNIMHASYVMYIRIDCIEIVNVYIYMIYI